MKIIVFLLLAVLVFASTNKALNELNENQA